MTENSPHHAEPTGAPRLLITAGPTHEPIDAVRFIGNRSSGRLGVLLAEEAVRRGWQVRLLLGPTCLERIDTQVDLIRFRTAADLEELLRRHQNWCDVLVMAAAVADYRPKSGKDPGRKISRSEGELKLELESTPDLLAGCASRRRAGQLLVGFALEPRESMLESAQAKLARKNVDMIVANPLETMESDEIEAIIISREMEQVATGGAVTKQEFAGRLLDLISSSRQQGGHSQKSG